MGQRVVRAGRAREPTVTRKWETGSHLVNEGKSGGGMGLPRSAPSCEDVPPLWAAQTLLGRGRRDADDGHTMTRRKRKIAMSAWTTLSGFTPRPHPRRKRTKPPIHAVESAIPWAARGSQPESFAPPPLSCFQPLSGAGESQRIFLGFPVAASSLPAQDRSRGRPTRARSAR